MLFMGIFIARINNGAKWIIYATVSWIVAEMTMPVTAATCTPPSRARHSVTNVDIDGTIRLDNGQRVILKNIIWPNRPLKLRADELWNFDNLARAALVKLLGNKQIVVYRKSRKPDRYGRFTSRIYLPEKNTDAGEWLLERGLARWWSGLYDRKCLEQLVRAENLARQNEKGIWSRKEYRVFHAFDKNISEMHGKFVLVQGKILSVGVRRKRTYLNFGHNWSKDFTVVLSKTDHNRFIKAEIDPESLSGRIVRVRGWVENYQGSMIRVTHPEQIEYLDIR